MGATPAKERCKQTLARSVLVGGLFRFCAEIVFMLNCGLFRLGWAIPLWRVMARYIKLGYPALAGVQDCGLVISAPLTAQGQ